MKKSEYVKLELCGLTGKKGQKAQAAILEMLHDLGLEQHSHVVRERENEDGWFEPVFSQTGGELDG
jgi:hypothetical protein